MLVATAGHVDHGKTSLIKHLTGTDTDRLAEEKKRGLTIELGYAFYDAGLDQPIGFIDVPGHHRFINTMIAGVNSIDVGLLVVAADDGSMPQTLEHLQLLRLLGVTQFIAVVTKVDLVEPERLSQVVQALSTLVPNAPVHRVSNRTGEGVSELLSLLQVQAKQATLRPTEQQFRLYIDRVFTKKGAGLVVTGTSLSGAVKVGDALQLHCATGENIGPINVRVRGIHAQGAEAASASAGQRCAINLTGKIDSDRLSRGDFLCADAQAKPSRRVDTRFITLDSAPRALKHLGRVKLYIGTRRLSAKTYLLDRDNSDATEEQRPGQRVQLILEQAVLAFAGDRFVLRDEHENATLGGGVVLDPEAPQWGKSRKGRLKQLAALEQAGPQQAIEALLFSLNEAVSVSRCQRIWNLSDAEMEGVFNTPSLDAMQTKRLKVDGDTLVVAKALWQSYCESLETRLGRWHISKPMAVGIKVDQLQRLMRDDIPRGLFKWVLDDRIKQGQVVISDNRVHALGHRPTLSTQVQQDWLRLEVFITQSGLHLPLRSEIEKGTGLTAHALEQLVRPVLKRGELYTIGEKRLALPATLHQLAGLVAHLAAKPDGFSVIEAKQVFGLGRNLTIEILEFFDAMAYTKRKGAMRVIVDPDVPQRLLVRLPE